MKNNILEKIYTDKQLEVLRRVAKDDFFILGLHGAKRSGKTVVNNDVFLNELKRVKKVADKLGVDEPIYILAGTNSTAIQNNILQELSNKYNITPKFDKHGAFRLYGVKVVQIYTGTIAGLKRARGFTAYGAYINEASLATEIVFKEIISRCSGEGARIVWDSNPDNPNHWLKRDYIDVNDGMILDYHFGLDDNTFLSERYKDNIKRATPTGKFYDRDILGLWTIAEGAIYADYNKEVHEIDFIPNNLIRYYAGVDWGYEHYGSIVIIGEDNLGNKYLIDGVAKRHEHITFWRKKAKEYINKYGDIPFYCDGARPEYVADFINNGINAIIANKSVIAGITYVAELFRMNKLFRCNKVIERFDDEIYQYRWNSGSNKDEPIKEDDDVMDSLRYALFTQHFLDVNNGKKINKKKLKDIRNLF